jgi:glycosyltransferase involved in cell wall biosynthesis
VRRVLFVSAGSALGGAEHTLLLLLGGLREHGVEPTVVLFADGSLRDRLRRLGIPTVVIPPPAFVKRRGRYERLGPLTACAGASMSLPAVVRIARLARRIRADVVHTNGLKAHVIGGIAGRLAGIPVVWHVHDFPPPGPVGRLLSAAARLPALILAVSDAVAASVLPPAGRSRVMTVYNPVDLVHFHPEISRAPLRGVLGVADDVPLVGLVAHLTPWKGHDVFLSMASSLAGSPFRPRFVVAGGDIYETRGHAGYARALRDRVAQLGLSECVSFLGARDDVAEVLAALDVLVHTPTAPEPFGRVLAEAMAVGRPVVASRCGGIPEVVEDGVTGFLIDPGDVAGFASAVMRLFEDRHLAAAVGKAGRQRAEALFGTEAYTARVANAYRDIIAGRAPRS